MVQFVLKLSTTASPSPGAFTKWDLLVKGDIKHWKQERKKMYITVLNLFKNQTNMFTRIFKMQILTKKKKIMKMYENSQNWIFFPAKQN